MNGRRDNPGLLTMLRAVTAAQLCLLVGLMAVVEVLGAVLPPFDAATHLAPLWIALAVLGAVLAQGAMLSPRARRMVSVAAGLALVVNLGLMAPEYLRPIPGPTSKEAARKDAAKPTRIATFNLYRDNVHIGETAGVVAASGADIVLLQEAEGRAAAVPGRVRSLYPFQATCPAVLECGLVVLSKRPIAASGWKVPDWTSWTGNRVSLMWAKTLDANGKPVTVVTTHLGWPFPSSASRRQTDHLIAFMKGVPDKDVILTGDFNLTPWSFALRRVDGALPTLIRRTRAAWSWPARVPRLDRPAPVPLLPIDQIYVGKGWRSLPVKRLTRAGSDHFGLMVDLYR